MASYEPVPLVFSSVEPEGCSKDKAPIIFIHGLGASKEVWGAIPEMTAKATNRKVYSVDTRNHGDSPWSDESNFDCNVDDLLHFMDTIGAPKAILVGHSLGGVICMKAALRKSERVEKLVVEEMSFRKLPQPIFDLLYVQLTLCRTALEQVPADVDEETAVKIIFDIALQSIPEEVKLFVKAEALNFRVQLKRNPEGRWIFKANMDAMMRIVKHTKDFETEKIGVFEGPSCFIYGKVSPFLVGLDEPNIRKHFPNVKMVGIDDAGHSVHNDFPREFTDALLDFLQE